MFIPPTRKRTLCQPEDDPVQWALTSHYNSSTNTVHSSSIPYINTEKVASLFISILSHPEEVQLSDIAHHVTLLYQRSDFSSSSFIDYVFKHNPTSLSALLDMYQQLVDSLSVLALSLQSVLPFIDDIDDALLSLVSNDMNHAALAYIRALHTKRIHSLLVKDSSFFMNWKSGVSNINNIKRMYVLFQYYTIIPGELPGCLHQMILLNPAKTNMSSKEYHLSQLKTIKEFLFISKKSAEQLEMMNINAPLFHLIASYFYEFDPHSSWGMTDFIVTTLDKLNNQDAVYDISVLLYSFDNGCRGLSVHEDSAVRIASILDIIENVLLQLDGYDVVVWNTVLSLAQFLLEYVHDTIGISYGAWFESIFMKIQSVAETKKLQESFMNLFIDIIPYELPSILQIHAKVVHQKSSLNHASQYVSKARKRLLELGVDSSIKKYPPSIALPIKKPDVNILTIDEEIVMKLRQFIEKKNTVPISLLQDSVFRRQWFTATFLTHLFKWTPSKELKDHNELLQGKKKLIHALKEKGKIPPSMLTEAIKYQ